jgi:class 3 adenylate cyclase
MLDVARWLAEQGLEQYAEAWPISAGRAHEDDAERAVRAGLELVEAVARVEPHADVRLHARIGIATGQLVVGDLVGAGATRDEAVVGETPNLAAPPAGPRRARERRHQPVDAPARRWPVRAD